MALTPAEHWAADYLDRFKQQVEKLKEHPFVDAVRFWTFEPVSDQRMLEIEHSLGYSLDEYLKAFFKQTNGLHLGWYSKLAHGDFYGIETNYDAPPGTWYAGFDETEKCEGYVAIMPLDGIIDPKLRLSDDINSNYQRTGDVPGSELHYLDKYSAFNDVCIYLNGRSGFGVVFGEDHGAVYSKKDDYSFKQYMEAILKNYGALDGRMHSKPLSVNGIIKAHYENGVALDFLEKETLKGYGEALVLQLENELEIDLRKKYQVFADEELLNQPASIETRTPFTEEETDLARYILSLDKNASFSGNDSRYTITFDQPEHPLDFSKLFSLEQKMSEKEGNAVPLIWLMNLPEALSFDTLESSGLQTVYLSFGGKSMDFRSMENKRFETVETLWINEFSEADDFEFLRSFPQLTNLRLADFEQCRLPQDLTFLDRLESLMFWSDKPNAPLTELRLPASVKGLTLQMDTLAEIPQLDAPGLSYLEIRSEAISRVSNISRLSTLETFILKGGAEDFEELVNLSPGAKVFLEQAKFVTGDKKTDLKRKFALKHLDIRLS